MTRSAQEKGINIPIGTSNFTEIRRQKQYYVDKTGLIGSLVGRPEVKVMLFTRPRRFGKTTALRMLEAFFDIRRDSRDLFRGLEIMHCQELCRQWLNRVPTICMSLKNVDGLDYAQAYGQFRALAAALYREHDYLLESDRMTPEERACYARILQGSASETETAGCLDVLTRLMAAYYGRSVIVLLDEYDVPLAKAADKGYYREMVQFMRLFMQVFKDNDALEKAVITGCLRLAKESVFTGTNNFVTNSVLDTGYGEFFGFTQEEVDRLLQGAGLTEYRAQAARWYDGYRFGEARVYCPWDVMNYVRDHLRGYADQPKCYWSNSGDNAIVRSFVDELGPAVTRKFETLMAGNTIRQRIREDMTYDYLHTGKPGELENNFWSVLVMTGYLTRADGGFVQTQPEVSGAGPSPAAGEKDTLPEPDGRSLLCEETALYRASGEISLRIPNLEILTIFEHTVSSWFADTMAREDRSVLFNSLWNGDAEGLTRELGRLLRRTISYHDYREDFYHAFLAGIFVGAGYQVESNREHGEGRNDVVIYDGQGDRAAVIELKCVRSMQGLESACAKALLQIDLRGYGLSLTEDYETVLCYGVAFCRKRCLAEGRRMIKSGKENV